MCGKDGYGACMNIAVITSGGDSPGMNPCIAKLVLEGEKRGYNLYGYRGGYPGILNGEPLRLYPREVYGLFKLGGTFLKSGRLPELMKPEVKRTVIEKLQSDRIDALIVLGGDGSFRGAKELGEMNSGINFIGIPCTIDNNIFGSDYTLGHDTALNKLVQYVDDITDTALSMSKRIFLVETLGGPHGCFAQNMADMGLCDFAIIKERPITDAEAAKKIAEIFKEQNKDFIIVAVSEHTFETNSLVEAIRKRLNIEPKINMIAYQQRGGAPTALERLHAASFAMYALRAVESGILNKYVVYTSGRYEYMDLAFAGNPKPFLPWLEDVR